MINLDSQICKENYLYPQYKKINRNASLQTQFNEKEIYCPFIVNKPIYLKSNTYTKTGHWSLKEKIKFIIFVDFHKEIFSMKDHRRQVKIFKNMASFIKTRNSTQCRSHHQKIQKQYDNICNYVKNEKKTLGSETYTQHYKLYYQQLQSTILDDNSNQLEEQNKQMSSNEILKTMKSNFSIIIKDNKAEEDIPTNACYVNKKEHLQLQNEKLKQQNFYPSQFEKDKLKNNATLQGNQNKNQMFEQNKKLIEEQRNFLMNECTYHLENWMKSFNKLQSFNINYPKISE